MNKIWNAFRYCEINFSLTGESIPEFQGTALDVGRSLDSQSSAGRHRGHSPGPSMTIVSTMPASELYQFFWHEFCDWYLEITKTGVSQAPKPERLNASSGLMAGL